MKTTIIASFLSLIFAPIASAQRTGDVVADGRVDGGDLGTLLADWSPCSN